MKGPTSVFYLLLSLFFSVQASAQISLPIRIGNNLKPAIDKVLTAWPDNYQGILGDTISVSSNEIIFSCSVKPEAAEGSTITEYLNKGKHDFAWQAIIFRSEDFNAAAKKYSSACQQLKNLSFRTAGVSSKLEGEYEAPNETKNFYSTVYSPATSQPAVEKLRVEVLLQSDVTGWILSIQVYERVHDDKEGSMN